MPYPVFFSHMLHWRALEHFQESKLYHRSISCHGIIERLSESLICLKREPCNEIQMHVCLPAEEQFPHDLFRVFEILYPVHRLKRGKMCRLNSYLEKHLSLPRSIYCIYESLIYKVCRYLEMKLGVRIMSVDEFQYLCSPLPVHIESPVHELHLQHMGVHECPEIPLHLFDRRISEGLIGRRQAVCARERAAPRGLIIHEPSL